MATIVINRPTPTRPSFTTYSTGSDYIRGTGSSEVLGYNFNGSERAFLDAAASAFGISLVEAFDLYFRGELEPFGGTPNYSAFAGADRIYARGGNDYIVDLLGSNLVVAEEGNERILLGFGNDRVFDQGGDNRIDALGGNNTITTRDGNDTITTGDGVDNINAFDGTNVIDAGDGDNLVRGGDDFDDIMVGSGDDFVDVRGGNFGEDLNGNGVIDIGEDRNFNGVLDPADAEFFFFANVGVGYQANNYVLDTGGSDNIRSTASSSKQGDDVVLSDVGVETELVQDPDVGEIRVVTITSVGVVGDDTIELGAGDNLIIDAGGDNTVRTLEGNDTVFTSFVVAGNDNIDTGAGSDTINPGTGSDTVRPGAADDFVFLENDGEADTLVYMEGDQAEGPALADLVSGFDVAGGVDKIDMRAFDLAFSDVFYFNALDAGIAAGGDDFDLLIGWDANKSGNLDADDFFTTILVDIDPASEIPDASNYLFDVAVA